MTAASNSALEHQLKKDENVVIFGEDVGITLVAYLGVTAGRKKSMVRTGCF